LYMDVAVSDFHQYLVVSIWYLAGNRQETVLLNTKY
jgi:hypothetical protein